MQAYDQKIESEQDWKKLSIWRTLKGEVENVIDAREEAALYQKAVEDMCAQKENSVEVEAEAEAEAEVAATNVKTEL